MKPDNEGDGGMLCEGNSSSIYLVDMTAFREISWSTSIEIDTLVMKESMLGS